MALLGLLGVEDWSRSRVLYTLERLKGFGYRRRGRPTPYLKVLQAKGASAL